MNKEEISEKCKGMIEKAGPMRLGIIVVSGILLILLSCGGTLEKKPEEETMNNKLQQNSENANDMQSYQKSMEEQVKQILEQVDNINHVDVMITLRASREKVTLKDNTTKVEQNEEETVLIEDENNNTSPYVVQEVEPEIEGILVVCDAGDSPAVQREIIDGISALFPVDSHKIKVMKSKEAK